MFACLAKIKPKKRVALLLRVVEGMSFEEIARARRRDARGRREARAARPARARRALRARIARSEDVMSRDARSMPARCHAAVRAPRRARARRAHDRRRARRYPAREDLVARRGSDRRSPSTRPGAGCSPVVPARSRSPPRCCWSSRTAAPRPTASSRRPTRRYRCGSVTRARRSSVPRGSTCSEQTEQHRRSCALRRGRLLGEFEGGHGRSLRIEAPGATIEIVGTLFAVDVHDAATVRLGRARPRADDDVHARPVRRRRPHRVQRLAIDARDRLRRRRSARASRRDPRARRASPWSGRS